MLDHVVRGRLGGLLEQASFPPCVSLHLFRSMGFSHERNRPPPRFGVFPWRPAWAFEEGVPARNRPL